MNQKKTKVGQELIAGLEEAVSHAKGKINLRTTSSKDAKNMQAFASRLRTYPSFNRAKSGVKPSLSAEL